MWGSASCGTHLVIRFWGRAISISTRVSQVRFIAEMEKYAGAVVEQAKDRDEGRLRTLDEFWQVRTLTAGTYPSFEMADLIVGLPEEIIEHPLICSLRSVIADMILLNNVSIMPRIMSADGRDCIQVVY